MPDYTLSEAAPLIRSGDLSPLALTEACLERIDALETRLNTFITLTAEQARAQARQAEAEIKGGHYRGPLHGIPFALKDLYDTAGLRTTGGTTFFAQHIPAQDACLVEILRQAGMVLLGKLNMHEIALGITNENPHYGPCRNPWDTRCITGGSSGGSAAALAAGFCLGSLGSDTGGSIRIPAALCGVVGLKPTSGRCSLRGIFPLSWNLDHAGPMARSVTDAAMLLQLIAGYDAQDPYSVDVPVDDYLNTLQAGVQGWRIALADDAYFHEVDADMWAAVEQAARVFEKLGAQVTHVSIPEFKSYAQANAVLVTSDAAAFHRQRLQENPQGFGADVLRRLQTGAAYTSGDYSLARRTQTLARHKFAQFFEQYDLLLLPATPSPAHQIGGEDADKRAPQLTRFTAPFNLTGLPALSVPAGFSQGLPLGLQIVGGAWQEAAVLRAAYAFEQATGWHLQTPPLLK